MCSRCSRTSKRFIHLISRNFALSSTIWRKPPKASMKNSSWASSSRSSWRTTRSKSQPLTESSLSGNFVRSLTSSPLRTIMLKERYRRRKTTEMSSGGSSRTKSLKLRSLDASCRPRKKSTRGRDAASSRNGRKKSMSRTRSDKSGPRCTKGCSARSFRPSSRAMTATGHYRWPWSRGQWAMTTLATWASKALQNGWEIVPAFRTRIWWSSTREGLVKSRRCLRPKRKRSRSYGTLLKRSIRVKAVKRWAWNSFSK